MNDKELAELDLAVARIEQHPRYTMRHSTACPQYSPTRDGAEAMRLLEKYELCIYKHHDKRWCCHNPKFAVIEWGPTPTPAIAICRAVVALNKR